MKLVAAHTALAAIWFCPPPLILSLVTCPPSLTFFLPLSLSLSLPMNNFDHEDAETQYEDDELQNDAWQALFDVGDEVKKECLASAPWSDERPQDFPPWGRLGLRLMWG